MMHGQTQIKFTQLKLRGKAEEELHSFLNSGLDADVWTASRSGRLNTRGKNLSGIHVNRKLGGPENWSGYFGED
jgi:hypothetical protein